MIKISTKLLAIQNELKAPKSQYNNFGKYNYRNCEDILEAVKPLLKQNKATLIIGDEIVEVIGRYYIKATAKLICCESGELLENSAFAREEETKKGMDGSQITGASSSYARKYALNGLFAIEDTKDSDTPNNNGKSIKCEKCKKEIVHARGKTPSQIADGTKNKYGKVMCMECAEKAAISTEKQQKKEQKETVQNG